MKTIEQQLKAFFQQPYSSSQEFLRNVIFPVFGEEFFESAGNLNVLKKRPELRSKADASGILEIRNVGQLLVDGSELDIFDITLDSKKQLQRNRVEIQQIIRSIISTLSGAFILFHYQSGARWEWRFTFCHKGAKADENTDAKRYTFLLGPGQSCRTAAENFVKIHDKIDREGEFEMADIIGAFDVEALSKEFFGKYKSHYEKFCSYIYNNRYDETKFGRIFAECEEKTIRDYVKKLLGRLVFLQFLQKKGWLGGTSNRWDDGDKNFLQNLYKNATQQQKDDFLDAVLEPLFHNALDTNRTAINQDYDTGVEGFRCCKIPYLNGGLFGKDRGIDDANSDFPAEYFGDLFEFFYQYNFTIDENDPNDAEVGVDPEMLGRIFENLLEDNKDKGAFYTPKAIVQYMCKESLIAYLQNGCKTDRARKAARDFVESHDAEPLRQLHMEKADGTKLKDSVLEHFDKMLRNVKVCDPAIGSGAFPMGMLRELFECRAALEDYSVSTPADIKKDIIQNNIYGVDIEKGAVDIARLRFWLTLILDEEDPKALPNLDFKIMQGNSLLESFHGVDLSQIAVGKQKATKSLTVNARTLQGSLFFQDEEEAMKELQKNLRQYFSTDDHAKKDYIYAKIESSARQYLIHKTEGRPDLQAEVETLPLCNDQFFLWHTFFADVFEQGGFDVVIGNPPYIRQEKLGTEYKELLTTIYPNVGNGTADMYVYFFGLGLKLAKDKGVISYITLNKYLKTKYGRNLRNTLARDVTITKIIDFFELPVFNASTDSAITVIINHKSDDPTKYFPIKTLANLDLMKIVQGPYRITIKGEEEWQFVDSSCLQIMQKLYTNTIPLTEYVNGKIYIGIKTGLNKVFILKDPAISAKLLSSESWPLIKKYAEPRDIKQWEIRNDDKYILATGYDIDIEHLYPTAFEYLNQYKEELIARGDKGKNYWNLRSCAYYAELDKPKLIYIYTAKDHQFYFDIEGRYVNNSCFMIITESRFLFCFLNSKLFKWFKRIKFVAYGDGEESGRCKLDYNKMVTVPVKKEVNERPFAEIVDRVYNEKKKDPRYNAFLDEAEIDRLVYQLYGLTEEEIKIVEGTSQKTS